MPFVVWVRCVTDQSMSAAKLEAEELRGQRDWLRSELGLAVREVQGLREELDQVVDSRWTRLIALHRRLKSWLRGRRGSTPGRVTVDDVVARSREGRGVVVFLPSVDWDIALTQRPHHIARCLAARGFTVVFASTPGRCLGAGGCREIAPGLFVHTGPLADLAHLPAPVVWSFPTNFHLRKCFGPDARVVYDWIDDLSVFPQPQKVLRRNHREALAHASLVLSVAGHLHAQACGVRPDALLVPNGVESGRFAPGVAPEVVHPVLDRLRRAGQPVLGYTGALARWFDYSLLQRVALARPDWQLLLVGPRLDASAERAELWACANVAWVGPQEYRALPAWVEVFTVACIPFVVDEITRSTSPLKLYEYFAAGKPVVTTPMPECEAFAEVFVARDAGCFGAQMEAARAASSDPDYRARLRALAVANSWQARVQVILDALGV